MFKRENSKAALTYTALFYDIKLSLMVFNSKETAALERIVQ